MRKFSSSLVHRWIRIAWRKSLCQNRNNISSISSHWGQVALCMNLYKHFQHLNIIWIVNLSSVSLCIISKYNFGQSPDYGLKVFKKANCNSCHQWHGDGGESYGGAAASANSTFIATAVKGANGLSGSLRVLQEAECPWVRDRDPYRRRASAGSARRISSRDNC